MLDREAETKGCVALLVGPDLWTTIDHGIEVAWRLAHELPQHPLRWLAGDGDLWLSRHDLHHAGLTDLVDVVDPGDARALQDVSVMVRTGYSSSSLPMLAAAHSAGVPIAALRHDDLPFASTALDVFDVDALIEEARRLIDCRSRS